MQDAKNKFSAVVDAALAGQPQEVTRRGKPAVVVVSAQEYHRLLNAAVASRESFAAHLLLALDTGRIYRDRYFISTAICRAGCEKLCRRDRFLDKL